MRRKQTDPGGGELDRQRQAVQPQADLSDRGCVLVRQLKVRLHSLGALDKQPYCLTVGQLFDGQRFEIGPGQRQRGYRKDMLAAHVQHLSAGYQQLQLGAISEQFPHHGGRSRDLLKVIEEQQHHLGSQLSLKLIEQRSIACFP